MLSLKILRTFTIVQCDVGLHKYLNKENTVFENMFCAMIISLLSLVVTWDTLLCLSVCPTYVSVLFNKCCKCFHWLVKQIFEIIAGSLINFTVVKFV